MATMGRIGEYNRDTEEWTQYVERMKFYFEANDIAVTEGNIPRSSRSSNL